MINYHAKLRLNWTHFEQFKIKILIEKGTISGNLQVGSELDLSWKPKVGLSEVQGH